jgi:hypothetical protein
MYMYILHVHSIAIAWDRGVHMHAPTHSYSFVKCVRPERFLTSLVRGSEGTEVRLLGSALRSGICELV